MAQIYSVTQLTQYLKEGMESDPFLQDLWIRGEINNFYHHTSGHMYFTLKDDKAVIRAALFRSNNKGLSFTPKDGQEVLALGSVRIYPPRGQYQLLVQEMQPEGVGALYLAFMDTKERLEKEGLFDESRKKPLPPFPSCMGIISSLGGAALQDILSVLRRRYPGLSLIISPARVQGEGTPESVMEALDRLVRLGGVDLVIISRGGGSWEDLWPFNHEELARKVAQAPFPIISAIGHEIDYTILDLVADLRAPTPSAAAELAVSTRREIQDRIHSLLQALRQEVQEELQTHKTRLESLMNRPVLKDPLRNILQYRQRIDEEERRLQRLILNHLRGWQGRVEDRTRLLLGMSPQKVLSRGYALVEKDGDSIQEIGSLESGDVVQVLLADGSFTAQVLERTVIGNREGGLDHGSEQGPFPSR